MTVLRSASTSPSGEPKRKKPDTLKSRRVPVLSAPSSAAVPLRGASVSSGASPACRLGQRGRWARERRALSHSHQPGGQSCARHGPLSPEELLEAGELQQDSSKARCPHPMLPPGLVQRGNLPFP